MLIYANQAMTSHQYNIWTKDIVWKQLYMASCVNYEGSSELLLSVFFLGEGGSKIFKWHTLPI